MNGKIETERLLLRPLSPSDAEAVFAYSREANVGINAGWKPHESLEESEDALEKIFCGKKGIFGIVHKIDGKLIGTIGVIDDPKRSNPKAGMLGYAMSESYWGKGLMTEAAQAVLRFAFGPMALDLVSAYCYPHNLRSKRVLEKCGFAYEGRLAQSELRFDGALMDEDCYVLFKNKNFKESPMKKIKIAPSILSADFAKMGEEVKNLEESGADLVHCDVMDGVFVNNITFGIKMVEDIRKRTSLPLDCHLMIVQPEKYVERFVKAGADIVTVHAEACKDNLKETLLLIKRAGAKCGAVINPDTPVSAVESVIPLCDMALVMSVFPGFGGQKFMGEVLEKVRALRLIAEASGQALDIEIDGGITPENVGSVKAAGANVIVAGSSVFKAADRRAAIEALRGA